MTSLNQARSLANNITAAQNQFENYIRSSLQEYLDFLPERGSTWTPHYTNANYYTFIELDGKNFIFHGEEHYQYGEYDTPTVSLPFDFVEAPETYKARILAEIKSAEDKRKARIKTSQEERVAKLKAQLAAAEATLAKVTPEDDDIKVVSTINRRDDIRTQLASSLEQG